MDSESSEILQKKDWIREEQIGQGAYGAVFKGVNKKTNQKVAIKRINFTNTDYGIPSDVLRETVLLSNFKHPNIIKIEDVIYANDKMYIVLEYMNQNLEKFIYSYEEKEIPINLIREILKQIISGLAALNDSQVIHRDLKPQNILINYNPQMSESQVKIADFGLARTYSYFSKRLSKEVVTPLYRPPEIFFDENEYNFSLDMWSVGCIFAEMVNKSTLFKANTIIEMRSSIIKTLGAPNKDLVKLKFGKVDEKGMSWKEICPRLDDSGLDLLSRMLDYDITKRITPIEALNHEFFKNII